MFDKRKFLEAPLNNRMERVGLIKLTPKSKEILKGGDKSMTTLAQQLKSGMKRKKMTLTQVAEKAGISPGHTSDLLTGRIKNPTPTTMKKIKFLLK